MALTLPLIEANAECRLTSKDMAAAAMAAAKAASEAAASDMPNTDLD